MSGYLRALLRRTFAPVDPPDRPAVEKVAFELTTAVREHVEAGAAERAAYTARMRAMLDELTETMSPAPEPRAKEETVDHAR